MKKRKNTTNKSFIILIIIILTFFGLSRLIYATTIEKTTIQCKDENMYDALKRALNEYIGLGDADKQSLTIKIPTLDILKITEINLEDKMISDISGIENLTNLTSINLGKNNLTSIEALKNLEKIQELKINNNNHLGDNLDSVLSNMKNLRILNISNTGLKSISFIKKLPSLTELYMANSSFSGLNDIEGLHLTKLDVSGNQSLRTIESIIKQKDLTYLNISNTGIQKLELNEEAKIGIYNLVNLKELYVRGMDVDSLNPILKLKETESGEPEVFLGEIEVLDISYIRRNEYSYVYIPSFDELAYLKKLRVLYMQGNMLTDVNNIYKLSSLEEVNLKDNRIEDLSGIALVNMQFDEQGNQYEVIEDFLKATVIDLSNNEISKNTDIPNVEQFAYLSGRVDITYLDLSANHIYNVSGLGWIKGTIKLQDQSINMSVYKKDTGVDQYIILLNIFQNAKRPGTIVYSKDAEYITYGCTMNEDSEYQTPGLYNLIISKDKTEEDEMYLELKGGIADGSKLIFNMIQDSYYGMDSLVFKDSTLKNEILYTFAKQDPQPKYLVEAKNIINVYHENVQRITELDLSNKNIFDLTGMENLDALQVLNIAKNPRIESIEPLKMGNPLQKLNASETAIKDKLQPIEEKIELVELILNNIGLTKMDSINKLVANQIENRYNPILSELDVSANLLENIDGVQDITSLTKLSATRNKITEIPDLNELNNLERLTMYSNQISILPKLDGLNNLKYIFFSDNKLTDITTLSSLSNIIELELNNNLLDDEDILNLQNVKISRNLKISGNDISDIRVLKNSIGSVTELDISKNKIQDVSVVDSRFSENGTLTANNQKIIVFLKKTDKNEITYALPQIFIAAKTNNSYFYTEEDFETQNCVLSGSNVLINLEDLEEKVAVVKIIGGKAKDTELIFSTPIQPKITYSTTDWTNKNVEVTITFNKKDITIKNNDGKNKYTFEENGEFVFEFVDENEVEGSEKAEVTWIDKEPPKISGVENQKSYTERVTPSISDNQKIDTISLKKNNVNVENFKSGTKIEEIGTYELIAKDMAGNETKVTFEIKEEEKENPNSNPDPPEKEELKSEIYIVNNEKNIVSSIKIKTTVQDFKKNISGVSNIEILDKNNKTMGNNDYIGTGCTIKANDIEYKLIVEGDLNGTGKIELNDLAQAQKVYIQLIKNDELKKMALDLNHNNSVDLNDLAKLQRIYIGK